MLTLEHPVTVETFHSSHQFVGTVCWFSVFIFYFLLFLFLFFFMFAYIKYFVEFDSVISGHK